MPKVEISTIDPVTFEVLRGAFIAAVDEMGVMLEKAAFSLVVSEGRDFSTSFCDGDGNLVADGIRISQVTSERFPSPPEESLS